MIPPRTYRDCLGFFYARNQFAMKLGLDNIRALLDRLGSPDRGMTFLHVAGTNGKGSVCANLAALLSASGYRRVGLYTSPHLVSFRERILVDGAPVSREFVLDWLRRAQPIILDLQATYFECATALALDWFRAQGCEAVVLETGLGGRLDATNAVSPALAVITSISLDHTAILGDTVEAIWKEKLGILKPGVPMVVAEERPALLAELEARAKAAGSPAWRLGDFRREESPEREAFTFHGRYASYTLPWDLRPEAHQRGNLALSLLAMETFLGRALPGPETLVPALRSARVPGRTQLLAAPGLPAVMLDGAHNPDGIAALASHLGRAFPGKRVHAVFSVMQDKDYAAAIRGVLAFAERVRFVPLGDRYPRALPYDALRAALTEAEMARVDLFPAAPGAFAAWLRAAPEPPDLTVVCGSLYLLGHLIPELAQLYPELGWFLQFEDEFPS